MKKSTHANLFDDHPPFQIDGNFGGTAGIAELLLQSHTGHIHLLPALPQAWHNGSFEGLKTRGNFEVSCTWKDNNLQEATILSLAGKECKIRTEVPVTVTSEGKEINRSTATTFNGQTYYETCIPTEVGKIYTVKKN